MVSKVIKNFLTIYREISCYFLPLIIVINPVRNAVLLPKLYCNPIVPYQCFISWYFKLRFKITLLSRNTVPRILIPFHVFLVMSRWYNGTVRMFFNCLQYSRPIWLAYLGSLNIFIKWHTTSSAFKRGPPEKFMICMSGLNSLKGCKVQLTKKKENWLKSKINKLNEPNLLYLIQKRLHQDSESNTKHISQAKRLNFWHLRLQEW